MEFSLFQREYCKVLFKVMAGVGIVSCKSAVYQASQVFDPVRREETDTFLLAFHRDEKYSTRKVTSEGMENVCALFWVVCTRKCAIGKTHHTKHLNGCILLRSVH